ncbi:non-homologous end-joining DNA ligase [Paradesulfitobacterium aromaticivorans]
MQQPIVPFEPVLAQKIPQGQQWVAQVKWDGVRVLTYYDGERVRLFNRKLNERTMQFPELTEIKRYCGASSVILDGEVIALDKGKPSFYKVMKRDGIRREKNVEQARRQTPIIYMVFDVIYYNGKWITDERLENRQFILNKIISAHEDIQTVENFAAGASLFEAIKEQGMEGVVCKDLNSFYQIDGKDERWLKIKNYRDIVAVVGGYTLRGETANALLLGLYDEQQRFWYIGHAGTGRLTHEEWRHLTKILRSVGVAERPFVNRPERSADAHWVLPELAVKIQYAEWTPGSGLRQPSIQTFVEVNPKACVFTDGIYPVGTKH